MMIIESLVKSLILTLIIELSVSFIIGIREKNDIKVVILANIITNPIVVFIANCVALMNNTLIYIIVVIILEILAVLTEYKIFKNYLKFDKESPMIISVINNSISFTLGLIISYII